MKTLHLTVMFGSLLVVSLVSVNSQQQQVCYPTADVVFLLDGSDSISSPEFQQQLELMVRFVNGSNIGPDTVRVGFAVISSSVGEVFPLYASVNKKMVLAAVQNVTQPQEGSRTDLGLVQMEKMFGLHGRPGVLRIGVIMTDGRAKFVTATEQEAAVVKNSGIFLVAIGVGRLINFPELEKIASTPSNAYNLIPLDLSSKLLSGTVEVLGRESCAGHAAALMDLIQAETNPAAVQLADKPFKALTDRMQKDIGVLKSLQVPNIQNVNNANPLTSGVNSQTNHVNPQINDVNTQVSSVNQPPINNGNPLQQQVHVDGLQFLNSPVYNILNTSQHEPQLLPQLLQRHAHLNTAAGTFVEQIPETTTITPEMTTATVDANTFVTNPDTHLSTGFGINFNGGIAAINPPIETPTQNSVDTFGTNPYDKSLAASGLNFGVPFQIADSKRQVPMVVQESIAPNVLVEKSPVLKDVLTPSPVREVTWPVSGVPQDQCSKARYVNGVGHTFVPNSCTDFILCRENMMGSLEMEVARCPFQTFYDDRHAVCKFYEDITCWRDPCFNQNADSYAHPGNCRSYWSCSSGSSVPMCCPVGSSFTAGIGCIRNITCQEPCMDAGNIKMLTTSSKCRLLPMGSNEQFFFEKVSGMGWMVRSCPPGSTFDQDLCNCVTPERVFTPTCRPELYLPFEEGVLDKSGNHLAMGNKNVKLDFGSGLFDGLSHLTLWRFSGVSFGQKIKITFRFRTSVWAPKGLLMHIVSNCCYGCVGLPQPSIDIALIPGDNGGIAVFSASTATDGETFLYVEYKDTFTGWNRLTYTYDGTELTGTVNKATESKRITGEIEARPHPLMIGACGQTGAFQGLLDDFEFYMCAAH